MAVTPALLYRGAAATSSTTLKTTTTTTIVTDIIITNTNAASQTATISFDGLVVVPAVTVLANSVTNFQFKSVLAASKVIAGFASSTDVKFHISGVEVS